MTEPDFRQMLSDSGMPTTAAEMQARWDAINDAQGGQITNNSQWSPFWRLISAIVTAPCQWLVDLLIKTALPNAFLKTAAGVWLDLLAWAVDVTRKQAVAARGTLVFTRENSAGELTVPAGTVVESPSLNGYVYRLKSIADTVSPDGQLSVAVTMRAAAVGSAYNLGPGYYSILPQPVSGIASVTHADGWLTTPGADTETDEELRLRCKNQFSAVGQYHHDAAYRAEIASFAGVRTDYLYFEHNAPRGPGSANCYIMLESGAPSQEFVDTINAYIIDSGNHGHGDDMLCFPMPETAHALGVTVWPALGLDAAAAEILRQGVEDRIRCAFRENSDYTVTRTWPAARFSFSRLGRELHDDLPGLQSVVFDQGDIESEIELPVLETLTVSLGVSA
jgi:uncharacterized phage protein gp47/JayE